jgi:hypothetical protein
LILDNFDFATPERMWTFGTYILVKFAQEYTELTWEQFANDCWGDICAAWHPGLQWAVCSVLVSYATRVAINHTMTLLKAVHKSDNVKYGDSFRDQRMMNVSRSAKAQDVTTVTDAGFIHQSALARCAALPMWAARVQ